MATVGRAFGFYIRYWEQMEALYRSKDETSLARLRNRPGDRKMVEDVGKRADEQAARLLKDCAQKC